MIKTVFTVLFLAALSVGHPGPNSPPVHPAVLAARQDNSTTNGTTVNSTTGSNTTTDNNSTVISGETLPVLKVAKCECPEVFCDPRQNAKSVSLSLFFLCYIPCIYIWYMYISVVLCLGDSTSIRVSSRSIHLGRLVIVP